MSREVAIDRKVLLNFTVATCKYTITFQPYTVGGKFRFI